MKLTRRSILQFLHNEAALHRSEWASIIPSWIKDRVRILEVWFSDDIPANTKGIDLIVFHHKVNPIASKYAICSHTILIDLDVPADELLSRMEKMTARQIRQAIKSDRIDCIFYPHPTSANVDEFTSFYDDFARSMGLLPVPRDHLDSTHKAGQLSLSTARANANTLVWHAYRWHRDQKQAEILYSSSARVQDDYQPMRNFIGRANRLLHFKDMLALREQGCLIYDFGGWYSGTEEPKRLQINRFKESFGGKIVRYYDCEQALTLLGRLYLLGRQISRRIFFPEIAREISRRHREILHPTFLAARGKRG